MLLDPGCCRDHPDCLLGGGFSGFKHCFFKFSVADHDANYIDNWVISTVAGRVQGIPDSNNF